MDNTVKKNKPRGNYSPYPLIFPNKNEKTKAISRAEELGLSLRQYLIKLVEDDQANCMNTCDKDENKGETTTYLFKIPADDRQQYDNQAKANDLSLRAYLLRLITRDIETSRFFKEGQYLLIAKDKNNNEISKRCGTMDELKQVAESWKIAGYETTVAADIKLGKNIIDTLQK